MASTLALPVWAQGTEGSTTGYAQNNGSTGIGPTGSTSSTGTSDITGTNSTSASTGTSGNTGTSDTTGTTSASGSAGNGSNLSSSRMDNGADTNRGFNWGWLGLIGLAGLMGMRHSSSAARPNAPRSGAL